MRLLVASALLSLLFSCGSQQAPGEFEWLVGEWARTDDVKGQHTFENWSRGEGQEYMGLGWTMEEQDTVFKENLRLTQVNEVWNLEVTGVNEEPTYFAFIEQGESNFTCENPENQFPNQITYRREGEKLLASIAGSGQEITFHFERAVE